MKDLKQIKNEFFKLQRQIADYAEYIDEMFERLGRLIEKFETAMEQEGEKK